MRWPKNWELLDRVPLPGMEVTDVKRDRAYRRTGDKKEETGTVNLYKKADI